MQYHRTDTQPHHPSIFKREDEQIALQRAKLEGRHETDDEHLSEPSTIHSLSHFEEHTSPTQTPKSTKSSSIHKAAELTPQGVEKADQAKELFGQKVSDFQADLKQKGSELKEKAVEKFGEEIQPEKDLDQEVKEHIKEINEEIKHHPHGEEEIVEGQGHAKYKPNELSSQKASELKGKLDTQLESLKQKASEFKGKLTEQAGEEIQPEKDLDQEVKEHIKEINEQIKHQPHGEEEIVEGQGQAGARYGPFEAQELKAKASSQLEGLKQSSKEIMDKASAKLDELKQKASQAQPVKEYSSRASGKKEEASYQGTSPQFEDLRSVSKEILDKALGKIDEMRDKASQQGQQIKQEAKSASSQFSQKVEQKGSEFSSQTEIKSHAHVEVQEGSQPLTKDAKEEIIELVQLIAEKIQELEIEQKRQLQLQSYGQQQQTASLESHEHHELTTESPSFVPTEETHELIEKVKEGLEEHVPLTEVVEELEHQHHEGSEGSQFQSQQKKGQPAVESLKQGAQELSGKISQKVEDVKNKFGSAQEGEFKSEKLQGQEPLQPKQPVAEKVKQGAQEASSKISETVQEVKETVGQKPEEVQEQRKPLVDIIMDQIHNFSTRIDQRVGDLKSAFKVEEKSERQEGEIERQPIIDVIHKNITDLSSKLSHNIESAKSKAKPVQEESVAQKPAVREQPKPAAKEQPAELPAPHEEGPSFRQRISGGIGAVSDRLSQHVENVKHRFLPEKGARDAGEFHKVKDGFSETVDEYKHEQRLESLGGHELQSENPFEPFEQLRVEQLEQRTLVEKVKEGFYEGLENLKVKLGKEPWSEEIRDIESVETVKEESQGLKQKLSGSLEGFKGKFRHGKEEAQKEVKEKVSESQPIEQPVEPVKQKGKSLKKKASRGVEGFKSEIRHGKEEVQQEVKEKVSESQPIEQQVEPIKQEGKSLKKKLQGKFRHEKEEVQQEVKEKVSESQPIEQQVELVKQGQSLKQRISGQLHGVTGKISHNIEAAKGKFWHGKEEAIHTVESSEQPYEAFQDEEPAESSQAVGQSLKQRIAGQISSLKSQFGAQKGEEAQEEEEEPEEGSKEEEGEFHVVTEGIDETVAELKREQLGEPLLSANPFEPLGSRDVNISQPLSNADQVGGDLSKLTSTWDENQPSEQPVEPVKEGGQSLKQRIGGQFHNVSSMISHNVEAFKGKFRHGKEIPQEEVSEEALEEVSEDQPIEQPAEPFKQESQSLKQKLSGSLEGLKGKFRHGKEEAQEEVPEKVSEGRPIEQALEPLIKQKLGGGFESFKARFKSGKQEMQEEASQKIEEVERLDEPAEAVQEQGQSIKQKVKSGKEEVQKEVSEKAGEIQSQPIEQPAEAVKEGGQSLKQKIGGQLQGISSKLSQNVESIKGRFSAKKGKAEESQEEEEGQEEAQQDEEEEFHTVKEGINETISELRKEQAGEPLLSSNPFQPLGAKDIDISQPLSNAEQVGGDLSKLTAEAGIENVQSQEESIPAVEESKSLLQKVKGGFIGATSMISRPFSLTKEKVMSMFSHENKENVALMGLVKDIEKRCLDESGNNNENA